MTLLLLSACTAVPGLADLTSDDPFPDTPATVARDVAPPADSDVRDQVLALMRDGPVAGLDASLGAHWSTSPTREGCDALREALDTRGAHPAEAALAECGDPADAERFGDRPGLALVWATARYARGEPLSDAAWEAGARAAADIDNGSQLVAFLTVACDTDHPERADTLWHMLEAAPPQLRAELAANCPHQTDPRLQQAHRRACAGSRCASNPDVLLHTDQAVMESRPWIPGVLTRYDHLRARLVDSLARCASDPVAPFSAPCLEGLAEGDWARAQGVASARPPSAEPHVAEIQASLERWDRVESMRSHLRDGGALVGSPTLTWREPAARPLTVLRNHGQVIDPQLGRSVADLVSFVVAGIPELDAARVREIPAPTDGRITVHLWLGTRRYALFVDPFEHIEWSDPGQIAGFLNHVFRAEGLDTRVAVPASQPTALVFGDGAALWALHRDGLLRLQDHGNHPE